MHIFRFCRKAIVAAALLLLAQPHVALASDISFNGFGNLFGAQAMTPELMPAGFTDEKVDFSHFSLMGLNIQGSIMEKLSFGSQLIATGGSAPETNFSVYAQWAFLNYTPNDKYSFKVGRQIFPMWMAAEFLKVGYLLPYRSMPMSVYSLAPFAAFDGASANRSFDIGTKKLVVGIFGGTPALDIAPNAVLSITPANLLGLRAGLSGDGWHLHAQASTESVKTTINLGGTNTASYDGHPRNLSLGARYDKAKIVAWAEYAMIETPDGSDVKTTGFFTAVWKPHYGTRYIKRATGGYALLGYRIGDFMPRYMFAMSDVNMAIAGGKTNTHVLGVNYQLSQQSVLKAEIEQTILPTTQEGFAVTQAANSNATEATAVYVGANFIF